MPSIHSPWEFTGSTGGSVDHWSVLSHLGDRCTGSYQAITKWISKCPVKAVSSGQLLLLPLLSTTAQNGILVKEVKSWWQKKKKLCFLLPASQMWGFTFSCHMIVGYIKVCTVGLAKQVILIYNYCLELWWALSLSLWHFTKEWIEKWLWD